MQVELNPRKWKWFAPTPHDPRAALISKDYPMVPLPADITGKQDDSADAARCGMASVPVVPVVSKQTFFERFQTENAKLVAFVLPIESAAIATVEVLAPQAELALQLLAPGAAPEATLIITKVLSCLTAANVLLKTDGAKATVVTFLNAAGNHIGELEAAVGIKDPFTVTKVGELAALIKAEVAAMVAVFHPAPPATV